MTHTFVPPQSLQFNSYNVRLFSSTCNWSRNTRIQRKTQVPDSKASAYSCILFGLEDACLSNGPVLQETKVRHCFWQVSRSSGYEGLNVSSQKSSENSLHQYSSNLRSLSGCLRIGSTRTSAVNGLPMLFGPLPCFFTNFRGTNRCP